MSNYKLPIQIMDTGKTMFLQQSQPEQKHNEPKTGLRFAAKNDSVIILTSAVNILSNQLKVTKYFSIIIFH